MPIQLLNKNICIEIYLPGKVYNYSRFDWTGHIRQITFHNKHTFCTSEIKNDTLNTKRGSGLCNEFGIDRAIGYEECGVGQKFHKIGVGLLTRKTLGPYNFFKDYKISPYEFSWFVQDSSAYFKCQGLTYNKYDFVLEKQIKLEEQSFSILYSLTNTGEKIIHTNEYVHNFLSIDNNTIDKNYILSFPFKLESDQFGFLNDPENILKVEDYSITWKSIPKEEFFIRDIQPDYKEPTSWSLIHQKSKVGIKESSDFVVQKMNLWGKEHVVSPEIFFKIVIEPGQTINWSRKYELFII